MAREYFSAYHSYLKSIEPLNDAERGRLFTACLMYSKSGEVPELRGNERFIFPTMKAQIDRDAEKYGAKCAQNRRNVLQRYTDEYERIRPPTKSTKEKDKEKKKTKDIPSGGDARAKRFVPPTLEEVRDYVTERQSPVDPQEFIDFYSSKGWMVGKTQMKDWKAACRRAEKWEQWTRRAPTSGVSAPTDEGRLRRDMDDLDRILSRGDPL